MQRLTQREEYVMQIVWKLKEGFVKDVIAEYPAPEPPYNTVSSIIRILEEKGYVGHKAYGRTHLYFPLISMEEFRAQSLNELVENYFSGSVNALVSQMVAEEPLPEDEIEKLKAIIEAAERRQKEGSGNE